MADQNDELKGDLAETLAALTEAHPEGCFILVAVIPDADDGSFVTAVTNMAPDDMQDVLHELVGEEPEGAPFSASLH